MMGPIENSCKHYIDGAIIEKIKKDPKSEMSF